MYNMVYYASSQQKFGLFYEGGDQVLQEIKYISAFNICLRIDFYLDLWKRVAA